MFQSKMLKFEFYTCIIVLLLICKTNALRKTEKYDANNNDVHDNFRLPKFVYPLTYNISLKTYIPHPDDKYLFAESENFKFNGSVSILIVCHKATNRVVLNVFNLTIDKNWRLLDLESGYHGNHEIPPDYDNCLKESAPLEQYSFCFKRHLVENKHYLLTVNFSGIIHDNEPDGFYRGNYTSGYVQRCYAVTLFEPMKARSVFPCFDEPDFKAQFTLSITHPKQLTALSNTRDISIVDEHNGWMVTTFETTPIMSTYIVAFVISDFPYISVTTISGVQIRVWATPEQLYGFNSSLEDGKYFLEKLEYYFDIPYKLPKLDMVALPRFDGAMENWGLVTYSHNSLADRVTVAHELVHQWFGNYVTMKWWNDLWLNEGFAEYISSVMIESDDGIRKDCLDFLSQPVNLPLSRNITTLNDAKKIFNRNGIKIAYYKAACVIRMFVDLLGSNYFEKAMQIYLKKFLYKNVDSFDLWNTVNEALSNDDLLDWNNNHLNVTEAMMSWTMESGLPVIKVNRDQENGTVYFNHVDFVNENKAAQWYIFVRYQIGPNPRENKTVWLTPHKIEELSIEQDSYIVLNHGGHGFYRTDYDEVSQQLIEKHASYLDNATKIYFEHDTRKKL